MFRTAMLCAALAVPAAAMAAPISPATFVMKAGASDLFEIDESKLMLGSTNPQIRQFAQKMIHDHSQSTAMVKAAAMQAGLHPNPPALDAAQRTMLAKLRATPAGAARDRLYVEQQKPAHQQALTLMQTYAADGGSAPLKAAAAKIVPVVQTHIQMLGTM